MAMLRADAELVAVFGDRIYPDQAERGAGMPRLVYTEVEADPVRSLRGRSRLTRHLVQIDVHGRSRRQAREAAALVVAALEQARGQYQGRRVRAVLPPRLRSGWAPGQAGDDDGHPVRSIDVVVWTDQ